MARTQHHKMNTLRVWEQTMFELQGCLMLCNESEPNQGRTKNLKRGIINMGNLWNNLYTGSFEVAECESEVRTKKFEQFSPILANFLAKHKTFFGQTQQLLEIRENSYMGVFEVAESESKIETKNFFFFFLFPEISAFFGVNWKDLSLGISKEPFNVFPRWLLVIFLRIHQTLVDQNLSIFKDHLNFGIIMSNFSGELDTIFIRSN